MRTYIKAAKDAGTTYYKIPKQQLIDFMSDKYDNVWTNWLLTNNFSESIINDSWFDSSLIIDDALYYGVTDYLPIEVDGEEVYPDEALSIYEYNLDALSKYIVENTPKEILNKISEDDFVWNGVDIDKVAIDLLNEGISLQRLIYDADTLSLVES